MYESSDDENGHVVEKRVFPLRTCPLTLTEHRQGGAQDFFAVWYAGIMWLRERQVSGADCVIPHRRDASLLPHIAMVDNPHATPGASIHATPGPSGSRVRRTPAVPSEEWQSAVEEWFKSLSRVRPELSFSKVSRFTARQNMD